MPIRLNDFAKERKDLTVATPIGDIEVVYRPNALTPSDEARLAASREDGAVAAFRELLEQFCRVLVAWDLVGPVYNSVTGDEIVAEDVPIPVRPDILQHVASPIITLIFRTINEDNVPKSSKTSRNQTGPTSSKNSGAIYSGSFD